jgi:hypothetical protein
MAITACAAATIALVPSTVVGSAADDLNAVMADFQNDNDITPCLFTKQQLINAKSQIPADFNAYAPEFKVEINAEINRWDNGGCSGNPTGGSTAGLKIVSAKGKGKVKKESVKLKNTGSKKVSLKGYSLRNIAMKKIKFKKGTKIASGKTLRVLTKCQKGKKKASVKGKTYYACKSKEFWKDSGDVAQLLNKSGTLIAARQTK